MCRYFCVFFLSDISVREANNLKCDIAECHCPLRGFPKCLYWMFGDVHRNVSYYANEQRLMRDYFCEIVNCIERIFNIMLWFFNCVVDIWCVLEKVNCAFVIWNWHETNGANLAFYYDIWKFNVCLMLGSVICKYICFVKELFNFCHYFRCWGK